MMKCDTCPNERPDELAPAYDLPWFRTLCANCWSLHTDLNEAALRGDWATFLRLADHALPAGEVA